jgi:hypothetical protein
MRTASKLLSGFLIFTAAVCGQTITGDLVVSVTDPSGGPFPPLF